MSVSVTLNGNLYVFPDQFRQYGWFDTLGNMLSDLVAQLATSTGAASGSATTAGTAAGTATTQAAAAAASATSAANYAAALNDTSTTSLAIAATSKTFTVSANKQFATGQFILAVSAANSANYMHGQVTSYSGTTLVVNVLDIGGSGTHADWNLSVSGSQGATGATGGNTVAVQKDGSAIGTRGTVNFITGANTTLTVADNSGSSRVDVTVATTAAATPALTLIQSQTASAVSSLTFSNKISATYDNYLIVYEGVFSGTNNDDFCFRIQYGGSTVDVGNNYDWTNLISNASASTPSGAAATSFIKLAAGVLKTSAINALGGSLLITSSQSTAASQFTGQSVAVSAGAYAETVAVSADYNGHALTGVQFFSNGGALTGTFKLYGIQN